MSINIKEIADDVKRSQYRKLAKRVNQRLVRAERRSAAERKKMTGYKQAMNQLKAIGRNRFNEGKNVSQSEIDQTFALLLKLGGKNSLLTVKSIKDVDTARLEGFRKAMSTYDTEGNLISSYDYSGIKSMDDIYPFLESKDFQELIGQYGYENAIETLDDMMKEQPSKDKLMTALSAWRSRDDLQSEKASKDFLLNYVKDSDNN